MRKYKSLLLLLALAFTVAGCGGGKHTKEYPDHRYWTVLVYMCAANNLGTYALLDMNEMERVGSTDQVEVIVQVKRTGYADVNGTWDTTRRYRIEKDTNTTLVSSPVVQDLGSIDMGDPDSLRDFIAWGKANYPADHYLLVVWDHGQGWQTSRLAELPVLKSVCQDDTTNSEISLSELAGALQGGGPVDVLLFDACLMQMLEVGYAIKDNVSVMAGSENSIRAAGLEYQWLLSSMNSAPDVTAVGVGSLTVENFKNMYSGYNEECFSAVDLSAIGGVASAVDSLADALIANMGSVRTDMREVQANIGTFDYSYSSYKDLFEAASDLSAAIDIPSVQTAAQDVMNAVSSAVISEWHSSFYTSGTNPHGLTIYFPASGAMSSAYPSIGLSADTSWDEMLDAY